jgi:malto-oligosyltrehalose synthase
MTLRATYRLQFHKHFTFADGEALVPYLADLGISHVYASPIATARPGSTHGYDVVDPTRVNPELGGEEGLKSLVDALRRRGLGLIIDIVPNHMAACTDNAWWMDVLRHGRQSRYARAFDIDWECEDSELRGRIFLPVLAAPLHDVMSRGELVTETGGEGWLKYGDLRLPLRPGGLEEQSYRLGWWRSASDRINWRRFFDINELVCLRMEDEATFEEVHALILRLVAEGCCDGVRVDHVDGLSDPAGYCRKLRQRLESIRPGSCLYVEKILLRGEQLAEDWRCDGTTGYDFMDQVSALQHDAAGEAPLAQAWESISERPAAFAIEEQAARREILARSFSAPLEATVAAFDRLARSEQPGSDLSRPALRRALIEVLAHFPVYRTYAARNERPAKDRPFLEEAVRGAKSTCLPGDRWVIDLVHDWMREPTADVAPIAKFQQLSAPVAAKAVEDTAFYRYGRLLSRNDVGFDLSRFGLSSPEFHARMAERLKRFPDAMLATATHDHKRGEDVRARLAVLSERSEIWIDCLTRWIERCAPLVTDGAPAAGDVVMLLQMIVGAWPLDLGREDLAGRGAFAQRLAGWQEKSLREAKLRSEWALPDQRYESAARAFLMRLVEEAALPGLLDEILAFVRSIAPAGAVNALAQMLIKLTAPGVPDIYQGTERWDFSLVDPDNRRPVDFWQRQAAIGRYDPADAARTWRDGLVKQSIMQRVLTLRRAMPTIFARGSYEPLEVEGPQADRIVAFMRRHEDHAIVTVVPRLPAGLMRDHSTLSLALEALDGTVLRTGLDVGLRNVLDDRPGDALPSVVAVSALFHRLPVALLSTVR